MCGSLRQSLAPGKGVWVNLIGLVSLLPLVVIAGMAQLLLPVILARFPGWRVAAGAHVLVPRSGVLVYCLAQGAILTVAALVAARIWHGDGCVSGVTGSPFCETLGEAAGRRLQGISLLATLLAVGAPFGALIAALAERAARRSAPLAKGGRPG